MAVAISAAATAGILAADGERDLFAMPSPDDFRIQSIERQPGEAGWPFAAGRGYLACAYVAGRRQGYFVPLDAAGAVDEDDPAVPLSGNPVEMFSFHMILRDKFAPIDNPAELVQRVAPLADIAKRLCDQPRGADVPRGDL